MTYNPIPGHISRENPQFEKTYSSVFSVLYNIQGMGAA